MTEGVSFVVPVLNGAAWLADVLEAIAREVRGRPAEIIVVEDGSRDDSAALLRTLADRWPLRVVNGPRQGAAAAINAGIRAATFPFVAQVDQDVVLDAGWLERLLGQMENPAVGAAQGYYRTDPTAPLLARAMSLDLEQRYAAIEGDETDHVCTGNTLYRTGALRQVGCFDERLGYGYDNDISYRLHAAGYGLRLCRRATSIHRWRDTLAGYLVQQYGFGYGRVDLVAKHPHRASGDAVSPAFMMWHPLVMAMSTASLAAAGVLGSAGARWQPFAGTAAALFAALFVERLIAGVRATRRFGDNAALAFPVLHCARDIAWVAAILMWTLRRAGRRPTKPSHSMHPRPELP